MRGAIYWTECFRVGVSSLNTKKKPKARKAENAIRKTVESCTKKKIEFSYNWQSSRYKTPQMNIDEWTKKKENSAGSLILLFFHFFFALWK